MATSKFENTIKQKLEGRNIQPSANAWGRMSKRLDTQAKNRKQKLWFYGVAASLIGVLFLVGSMFDFNKTTPKIVNTTLADSNKSKAIIIKDTSIKHQIAKVNIVKDSENVSNKKIIKTTKNTIDNTIQVARAVTVKTKKEAENSNLEALKIEQIVAKVVHLQEQNKHVTDAEIEALLIEAQNDIRMQSIKNQVAGGTISAEQLLYDVEADLNQSFRDRVFEAIKEKLGNVKTAIANRNE